MPLTDTMSVIKRKEEVSKSSEAGCSSSHAPEPYAVPGVRPGAAAWVPLRPLVDGWFLLVV